MSGSLPHAAAALVAATVLSVVSVVSAVPESRLTRWLRACAPSATGSNASAPPLWGTEFRAGNASPLGAGAGGGLVLRTRGGNNRANATFRVRHANTRPTETIVMLGKGPMLRDWKRTLQLRTSRAQFPWWVADVDLGHAEAVEFKFAVRDSAGNLAWEPGANRHLRPRSWMCGCDEHPGPVFCFVFGDPSPPDLPTHNCYLAETRLAFVMSQASEAMCGTLGACVRVILRVCFAALVASVLVQSWWYARARAQVGCSNCLAPYTAPEKLTVGKVFSEWVYISVLGLLGSAHSSQQASAQRQLRVGPNLAPTSPISPAGGSMFPGGSVWAMGPVAVMGALVRRLVVLQR